MRETPRLPFAAGDTVSILGEPARILSLSQEGHSAHIKYPSGAVADIPIAHIGPIIKPPPCMMPAEAHPPRTPYERLIDWLFGKRFERLFFMILSVLIAGALLTYLGYLPK